jgi:hypothetical protein
MLCWQLKKAESWITPQNFQQFSTISNKISTSAIFLTQVTLLAFSIE